MSARGDGTRGAAGSDRRDNAWTLLGRGVFRAGTRTTRSVEMAEATSGTARMLTELATFDTGATKAVALASMQARMALIIVSIC